MFERATELTLRQIESMADKVKEKSLSKSDVLTVLPLGEGCKQDDTD